MIRKLSNRLIVVNHNPRSIMISREVCGSRCIGQGGGYVPPTPELGIFDLSFTNVFN